jgi:hypothetical protein
MLATMPASPTPPQIASNRTLSAHVSAGGMLAPFDSTSTMRPNSTGSR